MWHVQFKHEALALVRGSTLRMIRSVATIDPNRRPETGVRYYRFESRDSVLCIKLSDDLEAWGLSDFCARVVLGADTRFDLDTRPQVFLQINPPTDQDRYDRAKNPGIVDRELSMHISRYSHTTMVSIDEGIEGNGPSVVAFSG